MKIRHLIPISLMLLFCSCAAQYKPVSLAPVKASVTSAQQGTKDAQTKIKEAQDSTKRAQAKASSAQTKIQQLEKQVAGDKVALELAQGAQGDIDELSKELGTTQDALKTANDKLTWTWDQLQTAQGQLGAAQKTIDDNQKAVDHAKATERKYHFLKWGLVIPLAMALVGLVLFKFSAFFLGLGYIGIGLLVGIPATIFLFLSFKL